MTTDKPEIVYEVDGDKRALLYVDPDRFDILEHWYLSWATQEDLDAVSAERLATAIDALVKVWADGSHQVVTEALEKLGVDPMKWKGAE